MAHKQELTFYEFFSGGGMVRAGLGSTWTCLFANDNCEKKAASYIANWGNSDLLVKDIEKVTLSELPGTADLAWASFPCQDLSLAGSGAGLNGERSGTFWSYWRLMEQLRVANRAPSVLVLENVYGAITSHGGKDFQAIARVLARDHNFGALIIDSVHFLPQSRPRLFVIAVDKAIRLQKSLVAEAPSPAWHPRALIGAFNSFTEEVRGRWVWWDLKLPGSRLKTLEDLIDVTSTDWHAPEETAHILSLMSSVNRQKLIEAQKRGGRRVGTIYRRTRDGEQKAEVRFDGISGCLRTPAGGSSRQTIIVVEGSRIRTRLLSAREAARLMGLPESYRLPVRYNDAYHLAGDGVVVPVVKHLAKSLLRPILTAKYEQHIAQAA